MCAVVVWLGVFMRLLTTGVGESLTPLSAYGIRFLLLGCFVQPLYEGLGYILLCCVWLLSRGGLLFLKENRGAEALGEREGV